MTRELDDFLYQLEKMNTWDLSNYTVDDVWLADLTNEELIILMHELVKRLPTEEVDAWYEEEELSDSDWEEFDS